MPASSSSSPLAAPPRSIRDRAAQLPRVRSLSMLERLGRRMLERAMHRIQWGSVTLIDARGTIRSPHDARGRGEPSVLVRVVDPHFYSAASFGGSVGIAEAYMAGMWETDDLPGLIEVMTVNLSAMASLSTMLASALAPLSRLAYRLERNTRGGSQRNIHAHYDLGNEFFALFLDPTMTYSCGIFENGATSLEEAQLEKIDRACRKLELGPEHHLLEIGTGWGALALHAASRYGCRVTTTTVSEAQFGYASQRVREAGLADRITIVKQDYRDLSGSFDRVVSIEMIEAVGREYLPTYFEVVSRCLKADGAALIQAIVIRDQFFEGAARRRDFLKKYIFPGSCLPSVKTMLDAVNRRTDLRMWHLEDIGPHYVTTLARWREAFMARLDEARQLGCDDRFIRMWEYYFAYCEGAFRARHVGDVQMLLTKPLCRVAPSGEKASGRG